MSNDYQRIEVITGTARRRRWTTEQELRIIEESDDTGASVSELARSNGVGPNLLLRWRRPDKVGIPRQRRRCIVSPSTRFQRTRPAGSFLFLSVLVLSGCASQPNLLQGVSLGAGESPSLDKRLYFVLSGTGTCESVNVDWGDGTMEMGVVPDSGRPIEFSTSAIETRRLEHAFTGWSGGKTVTVEAASGCEGKASLRFNVPPAERTIAFAQPGTSICQTVLSNPLPAMIPRMLVHLRVTPLLPPWERGIHFTCPGCIFGADGKPGSVADMRFPFPSLREFSLVLRIGSQVEQGGTNVQFVTKESGPLEFCLNDGDNDVTNNRGGYEIAISVDQLGP
jgi:hypothetical protein